MKPVADTPVETYNVEGIDVLVKREDLAVGPPAPPFSKVRGLYAHLVKLKARGVTVIGYVETSISMAGWGVAWACQELGLKAVLYDPQYKETPALLKYHRKQWAKFSPDIIPQPAGRAKVNFYAARKHLAATYGADSVLLDLGLPFEETIAETAKEWRRTMSRLATPPATTIVNVGSGTICAGVLRGWEPGEGSVIGVMGRTGSLAQKMKTIVSKSQSAVNGLMGARFSLEDPGWEYTEMSKCKCPFPCHNFYDRKAWQWLIQNLNSLRGPILFWNIGRMN